MFSIHRLQAILAVAGLTALVPAQAADVDAKQALLEYNALLKQVYASEVKVAVTDRADGNKVSRGTYLVQKPVAGGKPQRELVKTTEPPPKSAVMDLPIDLAVKPELALPLGDKFELLGTEACDKLECLVVRTSGDLNGKGRIFFEARIRLIKQSGVPLDSAVTITKIPFADSYSYSASFAQSPQGFSIADSRESFLLKVALMKMDLERTQSFTAWKSRD